MKERFNSISPFLQAISLFLIGAVAFSVISMISSVVIGMLYPNLPSGDLATQLHSFPVQYMFIHFLPFQLGFLLTPGLVYMHLSNDSERSVRKIKLKFIIWSLLLFIAAFFLLPFFGEINLEIVKFLGFHEELITQKESADKQLAQLIGPFGSQSFYVGMLIIGLVTGIAEEFAFRRFLLHHMLLNTNKVALSIFSSAFIFALLHFNYIQMLPLFSFGIVLGLMYYVSGSIIPGIVAHALNNALNVYWLATDSFPEWMMEIDLKTTIPSTLLLMGLTIFYLKRK
jgi:hypothetical protein